MELLRHQLKLSGSKYRPKRSSVKSHLRYWLPSRTLMVLATFHGQKWAICQNSSSNSFRTLWHRGGKISSSRRLSGDGGVRNRLKRRRELRHRLIRITIRRRWLLQRSTWAWLGSEAGHKVIRHQERFTKVWASRGEACHLYSKVRFQGYR